MSEANQSSVPDAKKSFRNFAAWYAIVVPAVSSILIVSSVETNHWLFPPPWAGVLIFGSSFGMGIFSLFGKPLEVGVRALLFVCMLVSAFCGFGALFAWFFSGGLGC